MLPEIQWLPPEFDESSSLQYRSPLKTFLIKVASLCNLDCPYCYVYNTPDKSYKWKPKFLESNIALQIAKQINEHVFTHKLPDITIIFHGGEPLLAGIERFEQYVEIFSHTISCRIQYGLQTNGTILSTEFIMFFVKHDFRIGLSLDGPKNYNDINRLYFNGSSSFEETIRALDTINSNSSYSKIFGGLLMVINLNYDPREILNFVRSKNVTNINILLPDGHHEMPPPDHSSLEVPYGKWLYQLFSIWYNEYQEIQISYFENIITMLLGGYSTGEEIGSLSVNFIVIETNGDLEAVDTLKIVGREATSLGLNVFANTFDDAISKPAIYSRMSGYHSLCHECQSCEHLKSCGGGYIPHRFSLKNGFLNPSIYCKDLQYLFTKINSDINQNIEYVSQNI